MLDYNCYVVLVLPIVVYIKFHSSSFHQSNQCNVMCAMLCHAMTDDYTMVMYIMYWFMIKFALSYGSLHHMYWLLNHMTHLSIGHHLLMTSIIMVWYPSDAAIDDWSSNSSLPIDVCISFTITIIMNHEPLTSPYIWLLVNRCLFYWLFD
jgi:hypothetical protein